MTKILKRSVVSMIVERYSEKEVYAILPTGVPIITFNNQSYALFLTLNTSKEFFLKLIDYLNPKEKDYRIENYFKIPHINSIIHDPSRNSIFINFKHLIIFDSEFDLQKYVVLTEGILRKILKSKRKFPAPTSPSDYKVIKNYKSKAENEVSLNKDEEIIMYHKINRNVSFGKIIPPSSSRDVQAQGRFGIFPMNCVELKKKKKSLFSFFKKKKKNSGNARNDSKGVNEKSIKIVDGSPLRRGRHVLCKMKVLSDYEAENFDEISIKNGDVISVFEKTEKNWWLGSIVGSSSTSSVSEKIGLFPRTFCEIIEENETPVKVFEIKENDNPSEVEEVKEVEDVEEVVEEKETSLEEEKVHVEDVPLAREEEENVNKIETEAKSVFKVKKMKVVKEYKAKDERELELNVGDEIVVMSQFNNDLEEYENGYWLGRNINLKGYFPISHCVVLSGENDNKEENDDENVSMLDEIQQKIREREQQSSEITREPPKPSFKNIVIQRDLPKPSLKNTVIQRDLPKPSLKNMVIQRDLPKPSLSNIVIHRNLPEPLSNVVIKREPPKPPLSNIVIKREPPKPPSSNVVIERDQREPQKSPLSNVVIQRDLPKPSLSNLVIQRDLPEPSPKKNISFMSELKMKINKRKGVLSPRKKDDLPTRELPQMKKKPPALPKKGKRVVPSNAKKMEYMKAVFSYRKQRDDELDVNVNDVIEVIDKPERDWWYGKLLLNSGDYKEETGLFPKTFCVPYQLPTKKRRKRSFNDEMSSRKLGDVFDDAQIEKSNLLLEEDDEDDMESEDRTDNLMNNSILKDIFDSYERIMLSNEKEEKGEENEIVMNNVESKDEIDVEEINVKEVIEERIPFVRTKEIIEKQKEEVSYNIQILSQMKLAMEQNIENVKKNFLMPQKKSYKKQSPKVFEESNEENNEENMSKKARFRSIVSRYENLIKEKESKREKIVEFEKQKRIKEIKSMQEEIKFINHIYNTFVKKLNELNNTNFKEL